MHDINAIYYYYDRQRPVVGKNKKKNVNTSKSKVSFFFIFFCDTPPIIIPLPNAHKYICFYKFVYVAFRSLSVVYLYDIILSFSFYLFIYFFFYADLFTIDCRTKGAGTARIFTHRRSKNIDGFS